METAREISVEASTKSKASINCRICKNRIPLDALSSHECESPLPPKGGRASKEILSNSDSSPEKDHITSSSIRKKTRRRANKLSTITKTPLNSDGGSAVVVVEPILPQVTPSPAASSREDNDAVVVSPPPPPASPPRKRYSKSETNTKITAKEIAVEPATISSETKLRKDSLLPPLLEPIIKENVSALPVIATPSDVINSCVEDVRVTNDGYATYTIATSTTTTTTGAADKKTDIREYQTERRYREFYDFATKIYSIYPDQNLWKMLPPKTYCGGNTSKTFLARRKAGLDHYLKNAMNLLLRSDEEHPKTIGQLYAIQRFLDIPSTSSRRYAIDELKRHNEEADDDGWSIIKTYRDDDKLYEKHVDGCTVLKRVTIIDGFSPRAVFDMIQTPLSNTSRTCKLTPWIDTEASHIIKKKSEQTTVEHVVHKPLYSWWYLGNTSYEYVTTRSWNVEEDGSVVIVLTAADNQDWVSSPINDDGEDERNERADVILGGWILTPDTRNTSICKVTWVMQTNFYGNVGSDSYAAKSLLMAQAEHVSNVVAVLEEQERKKVPPSLLHFANDTTSELEMIANVFKVEPNAVLIIQSSQDAGSVVVLRVHLNESTGGLTKKGPPISASRIDTDELRGRRKSLSKVERTSTYHFSCRKVDAESYVFVMDVIKDRLVTLSRGAVDGKYGLFTAIAGANDIHLKRLRLLLRDEENRDNSIPSSVQAVELIGDDEYGMELSETISI